MEQKISIAVFNPQNRQEKAILDAYHVATGRWLTMGESKAVMTIMGSYLGLSSKFREHPESACVDLFSIDPSNNYFQIPCFQMELRDILRVKKIVGARPIAAFSGVAARKILQPYDTLIVVNAEMLGKPIADLGCLKIYGNELSLDGAVVRILTRQRVDSPNAATAERIVAEEYPAASVYPCAELPGIGYPKVAQVLGTPVQQPRFIVNIPSLGIKNEPHSAPNDVEAVQNALNRKFEDSGEQHRQPQFTAPYWQKSGFWDMIVRPADEHRHAMTHEAIQLNKAEESIFRTLLDLNTEDNLGLTFRVAGGWVRDKLLSKNSDDLDIAIDKMTGAKLGNKLQRKVGSAGSVIKANPDQSKHLETLTIRMFGQDVDFVNLRSEKYADSRIPDMEFGTANDDAFRRDLTINAMFFNINKWAAGLDPIEDLTGKGLHDLQGLLLRTPLPAKLTFMEDPLRVLRVLRFASRFKGAAIDMDAFEAMSDCKVAEALKNKVSPERVLSELYGLFRGEQPEVALGFLYASGIWDHSIKPKIMNGFHDFTMDQKSPWHVDSVFDHTLKVVAEYNNILRADGADEDERARCLFAAFLHDVGKLDPSIIAVKTAADGTTKQTYKGHDLVSENVAKELLTNLRASSDDIEQITKICHYHMLAHDDVLDKTLRRLIRENGRPLIRRIMQHGLADATSKPGANVAHYQKLISKVASISESAPQANVRRPVISGNILMEKFPDLKASSGYLKDIQNRLQDLRDGQPDLSEEEALLAVEAMRPEIEAKYGAGWYGQLKTSEAKQLCGKVLKKVVGLYDTEPTLVLETPQRLYNIIMTGESGDVSVLERLLGQSICALGLLSDGKFIISKYNVIHGEEHADQVRMEREKPSEATLFREGDRVRKRKVGLGFEQIEGKVVRIEKGLMYIKWNDIEDQEVLRLTDTVGLAALIQRV